MVLLLNALADKDHYASVFIACVGFESHCVAIQRGETQNASAPLALALAAATALGIKVPR
jgi:hypothetical protein